MVHKIFAFGTLKRNFPLHERGLSGAGFLGNYRTQLRYPMLVSGPWFAPMMFNEPGVGLQVLGELYAADDLVLANRQARKFSDDDRGGAYRRWIIMFSAGLYEGKGARHAGTFGLPRRVRRSALCAIRATIQEPPMICIFENQIGVDLTKRNPRTPASTPTWTLTAQHGSDSPPTTELSCGSRFVRPGGRKPTCDRLMSALCQ